MGQGVRDHDEAGKAAESIWGSLIYTAGVLVAFVAILLVASAVLVIPPAIVFYLASLVLPQEVAGALSFLGGTLMLAGCVIFMHRRIVLSHTAEWSRHD